MKSVHSPRGGFTLIEFLVAFGVAALVIVPTLSLLRQSLRLIRASEDMAVVAQAVQSPGLDEKTTGAKILTLGAEDIDVGPIRIRSVELEVVPTGQTDGVRVRRYQ
ncbi:prepilin-type N-terminal cleavage/methylation domain-containing protein [bacterium]|nr:prepilin-type N-terminal cleavage/methylation domain-containing protein [bacterium]